MTQDGENGEMGPVLQAFFERVRILSAADWAKVRRTSERSLRSPAGIALDWIRWRRAWRAVMRVQNDEQTLAIARAVGNAIEGGFIPDDPKQVEANAVRIAAMALAVRSRIEAGQFAYLYRPFIVLIPAESLRN